MLPIIWTCHKQGGHFSQRNSNGRPAYFLELTGQGHTKLALFWRRNGKCTGRLTINLSRRKIDITQNAARCVVVKCVLNPEAERQIVFAHTSGEVNLRRVAGFSQVVELSIERRTVDHVAARKHIPSAVAKRHINRSGESCLMLGYQWRCLAGNIRKGRT